MCKHLLLLLIFAFSSTFAIAQSSVTVLDHEAPGTSTTFQYFGSSLEGQLNSIVPNPNPNVINSSANVAIHVKPAGAQPFAGSFSNPNPSIPIDLTSGATEICIKVHMDHIGSLTLKFEQGNGPNWIQTVANTKVNEWEELCFDLTVASFEAPFTPAAGINYARVVLFFDFLVGVPAADLVSYYDDLVINTPAGPVTSDYCETETFHFGGDPGSQILLTISNIDATSMYVEIESATADPVDLLLVNAAGAVISAEDFSVPGKIRRTLTYASPPTDVSLNVLWSKASFPGNWQLSQADIVVPFAASCPVVVPPPSSAFCQTETFHFAGDPGSEILLTITNVDATSMYVEIESATADPVDLLIVLNGSGATISNEDTSVPGKIRRTLTWTTPPTDVDLNLLWSKASFPGNWQLTQTFVSVPFAAACPPTPSIPTMGQWSLFYLALIMLILGVVYVTQVQTKLELNVSNHKPVKFSLNQLPFDMKGFEKALKTTLYIVPFGFAFIYMVWGEIIMDDLIGMMLAIPLVAYLIYVLKK